MPTTARSGSRTFDAFAPGSVGLRPTLCVVHLGRPLGSLDCNKEKCRKLANRFKGSKDPFRIAIVRDMWLTGFDASYLHTMYADKPMQGHGLIQAIACVNRIFRSVTSESPSKISNPCNSNGPHTKLLSSTARPRFTGAIIP